ncbi:MAG: hypothetical protein ACYC6L_11180 [Anaerolineae bacterium]
MWTSGELVQFISEQTGQGVPVYLLDDSTAMSNVIDNLQVSSELRPAFKLRAVPYYFPGGGSDNLDITLYLVTVP